MKSVGGTAKKSVGGTARGRPQWTLATSRDLVPAPGYRDNLLIVTDYNRLVALDTGSEVSIGQSKYLIDRRIAKNPVLVNSIGGIKKLVLEGDVLLAGKRKITVMRVVFLTLDFSNPHLCKNAFYCNIQDKKQDIRPTALHTKTQVILLYNMDFKKSSLVPG